MADKERDFRVLSKEFTDISDFAIPQKGVHNEHIATDIINAH